MLDWWQLQVSKAALSWQQGVILIILGLLPVMGRLIAAIPMPVLGGAGLVLFGSVAASGIRTLAKIDYNDQKNLIIVATALSAGMIPLLTMNFMLISQFGYKLCSIRVLVRLVSLLSY